MKHSQSFWLSGKMMCGKCGYSFIANGSASNPFRSLRCRNRALYGKEFRTAMNGEQIGCDNHTVDERIVAAAMKNILGYMQECRDVLEQQMIEEISLLQKMHKEVDVAPLKAEIEKLENKKHKAIDLMLEEIITKDELKKQSAFYDEEIARITQQIAKSQNIAAYQKQQMNEITKTMENIRKMSDNTSDSNELYRSMLDKIVVPKYGVLNIYLNGVPFGFGIAYTAKKAPRLGIYDVVIDSCEVLNL